MAEAIYLEFKIPSAYFDPNVRVANNCTIVGLEDVAGVVDRLPCEIELIEKESGAYSMGVIFQIDFNKRLVYIRTNWGDLRLKENNA